MIDTSSNDSRNAIDCRRLHATVIFIVTLSAGIFSKSADAQDLAVTGLFPPGAAPGETVEITTRGTPAAWPVTGWVDRPGLTVASTEESGRLTLTVSPDAQPGLYWIRLHSGSFASRLLPFYIDAFDSLVETEPNNRPREAQDVSLPVAPMGRLGGADDVDGYAFELLAGQVVTAALFGHRPFGSPMDAVMQVCDADGNVLKQVDDARGLDPQVRFTADVDGRYLVRVFAFPEVPNSTIRFSGNDGFVYRLEIGAGQRFEFDRPVVPNEPVEIGGGEGESLGESMRIATHEWRNVVTVFDAERLGSFETDAPSDGASVRRHDDPIVDDDHGVGRPLEVWGLIDGDGETNVIPCPLANGQKVRVRVESRKFLLELDPSLVVRSPDGSEVVRNDDYDNQRMAQVEFTADRDGIYELEVSDATGRGADRFGYRLQANLVAPSFELTLDQDRAVSSDNGEFTLPVTITRQDGYEGEIVIVATNLPEGASCDPVTSVKGEGSESAVTLVIRPTTPTAGTPIRVQGTGNDGLVRVAHFNTGIGTLIHQAIWLGPHADPSDVSANE